jgi:molybdopterin synthase sulfur carrier subunit
LSLVQISYFAWVRERMGTGGEAIVLPAEVVSVAALIAWLATRDAAGAAAFADPARIRAAVDGDMAPHDTMLTGVREVALFPPVTGG